MEWLIEYVKQIACVSLLISFFKKIIPDDKYSKYADVTIGIIMILIVIRPVMSLIGSEGIFEYNLHTRLNEYINDDSSMYNDSEVYMNSDYIQTAWKEYRENTYGIYIMKCKEELNELTEEYNYYVKNIEYVNDTSVKIFFAQYSDANDNNDKRIKIEPVNISGNNKINRAKYTVEQTEIIKKVKEYFDSDEIQIDIEFE